MGSRGTLAWQVAEKVRQLRSRLIEILNVPQGYASGFDSPAALLDGLFEQPAGARSYCATRVEMRSSNVPTEVFRSLLCLIVRRPWLL